MISINLKGDKLLEKKLAGLDRKVARKAVRKGVRAGLKPVLNAAKSNAVSMVGGNMGGLLKRNLVIKAPKRQRVKGSYLLRVTLREGVEEFEHVSEAGKMSYIPSAIEYGHDAAQPIPFMRKASDSELRKAPAIFSEVVRKELK